MTIFYLTLALISGLCRAVQSPVNATLSRYAGAIQAPTNNALAGHVEAVSLLVKAEE